MSYYYNSVNGKCEFFCSCPEGGNANNFPSKSDCQQVCDPQAARDDAKELESQGLDFNYWF